MNNTLFRVAGYAGLFTLVTLISGCNDNIREQTPEIIAAKVKHGLTTKQSEWAWVGPELHSSHYRTLFYGYDTVDYRLVASEHPISKLNNDFRILIDAHYGGNLRHYDFAKLSGDATTRDIIHGQHDTERCQIFNSLISSCLYRDRFSLNLSQSDLERGRIEGLKLLLSSTTQDYERLDLPANYIQGFLKAMERQESK